ncbi:glycosyltransferase family 9 protein [Brevibacterium samyangense]|uniref:Glycosyltransferase family 9 protein n=1 Tax=Brevibacterium samyangense TaxID=366888 RepID=A0ABP5EIY0_9MICO
MLVVLRALGLGDLLVAVPALRGLRAGFPHHRIVLAAPEGLAPLVGAIDAVDDRVHCAGPEDTALAERLRGAGLWPVDTAVNLHGDGEASRGLLVGLEPRTYIGEPVGGAGGAPRDSALHQRERWVALLREHGLPGDPTDVRIGSPRGAGRIVERALRAADAPFPETCGAHPFALVHVGAKFGSRHWPVERFGAVTAGLVRQGLRVLVTGNQVERPRTAATVRAAQELLSGGAAEGEEVVDLGGRLGLEELCACVAGSALVVSVDTGVAHLASAYGRPSVVLFGPVGPELWGPPPGPHRVLTDVSVRRGDVRATDPDPALLAVTAADVLAEARALLQPRAPAAGGSRH